MKRKSKTLRAINLALPALAIALPCGASWFTVDTIQQGNGDYSFDTTNASAGKTKATFSGSSATVSYYSKGLLFGTTWETVHSGTMNTTVVDEHYTWDHACHTKGQSAVWLVADPVNNEAAMTIQWF